MHLWPPAAAWGWPGCREPAGCWGSPRLQGRGRAAGCGADPVPWGSSISWAGPPAALVPGGARFPPGESCSACHCSAPSGPAARAQRAGARGWAEPRPCPQLSGSCGDRGQAPAGKGQEAGAGPGRLSWGWSCSPEPRSFKLQGVGPLNRTCPHQALPPSPARCSQQLVASRAGDPAPQCGR